MILRSDRAQQHDGIQIDMRIEPGERQADENGATSRVPMRRTDHPAGRWTQAGDRLLECISQQKQGAGIPDQRDPQRVCRNETAESRNPHSDENDIGDDTDRADQTDMPTDEAVAQHEQVLGPDCEYQRQTRDETGEKDHGCHRCESERGPHFHEASTIRKSNSSHAELEKLMSTIGHLNIQHVAALARAVEYGSFERAAARLHVTPSAISQRMVALEETLGTPLVVRARPCRATPAGQWLCRHYEQKMLSEQCTLERLRLSTTGEKPRVRIAVNADSLATWLIPALAKLTTLDLELVIDNEDRCADWLETGAVSAAVSSLNTIVTGCDHVELGALRYRASASLAFIERWGLETGDPEALRQAPSLRFNIEDRLQARWLAAVSADASLRIGHQVPSTNGFVEATLEGVGWAMNPAALIDPFIAAGRLVDLAPAQPLDVPLVFQYSRTLGAGFESAHRAIRHAAHQVLEPL